MKFFFKIFATTMFVSVICVTLSGYLIIDSNFRSQLENEVDTAQDYCKIVLYSLQNSFEDTVFDIFTTNSMSDAERNDIVRQVVQSISIDNVNQKIAYCVIDKHWDIVFSSLDAALDKTMISSLNDNSMGCTIKETDKNVYIQTISPAVLLNSIFYIETVRDVSHVFNNQKEQYKLMVKIILGMIALAGVLTFIISKLLMRRIVALTEITKTISDGNLSERAKLRGRDEITLLSENFNHMTDRLEEKMNELRDEAERKEIFVGAFSHELKTPLTSIIGYSDLLRQRKMNEEQQRICADYIFTESKRLETMSMRLLELIVLKKQSINPKPTVINVVLDEVKTIIKPQLENSNVDLIYDIEEAIISMEAELMKTVFINVIDNARNAIDVKGTITVVGRRKNGGYVITIRDTGKGMEQCELEKIKNAFYMVDKSRSRKHGGAGLGLAICNEIVALHGFEIRFESEINVGTKVTIEMKERMA